jgi:hypothetical protein
MLKVTEKRAKEEYIPSKYRYFVEGEWVEEDDMAESFSQNLVMQYLINVIRFLFREHKYLIVGNIFVYPEGDYGERVAPDIMVIKRSDYDMKEIRKLRSWAIDPPEFPAPDLAFEISSLATWAIDVQYQFKPTDYAQLGVKEYFAFDPEGFWENFDTSLKGWRSVNGVAVEIEPNENEQLWSNELNCWVGVEGQDIYLYSTAGEKIVTPLEFIEELQEQHDIAVFRREEAEDKLAYEKEQRALEAFAHNEERKQAELARLVAEQRAQQQRLVSERRAEQAEQKLAETEQQKLEAEQKLAETEKQKLEVEERAEQARQEAERQRQEAEKLRLEAEQRAEQARLAQEKAEQARLELERRVAELQAKLAANEPDKPDQ